MSDVVGYVYKTTNLVNGKVYIGQHQREAFDPLYYGSGRIIMAALKKYGKESFTVEILSWEKTQERLDTAERHFIVAFDAQNRTRGYNLSPGGSAFNKGRKASEETRRRQRESAKTRRPVSDETRRKQSEAHKGKRKSPEWRAKIAIANTGKSRPMPEDAKRKISASLSGRTFTEEHKRKIGEANRGNESMLGRHHSEETKKKIGQAQIGHPGYMTGRKLTDEQKEKVRQAKLAYWAEQRSNLRATS